VTVGDLLTHLSRSLPTRPALAYEAGPRYTFAELEAESRLVARGLIARGVQPGERVVVWATNVPEWIVLQFALAKIGAILVTANTALRAKDIDYLLRQSEAATLVTIRGYRDLDYLAALDEIGATRGAIPGLERLFFISRGNEDVPPGFTRCDQLRADAARVPEATLDARASAVGVDDVINMQYTSGTTGFPKGVMLSSRNIVNNAEALGAVLGYTPDDRLCLCVPLFHCFGCVIGVLGAYTHGASLYPLEAFDAGRALATIEREGCTALYGVPTMFLAELEHPEFARFDLSSLRTGVMAGSLCPEPLMRRVMSDMHLPEIIIAYGLTEASPGITATPRDAAIADRTQTVGRVLPELEVKVIDAASEATRAAVDADGWLRTGDEASIDERGLIRITGRIKDLIIRGGENISPKEIEDCLREHPSVADAYVYGLPDEFFGEVVAAAVRARTPQGESQGRDSEAVTGAALMLWCGERLAHFKIPKYVRFVSEFPMTASGKIQKFKLREAHQAELQRAPAPFDASGLSLRRRGNSTVAGRDTDPGTGRRSRRDRSWRDPSSP
jgi:fatty-acyl-CoA synthase